MCFARPEKIDVRKCVLEQRVVDINNNHHDRQFEFNRIPDEAPTLVTVPPSPTNPRLIFVLRRCQLVLAMISLIIMIIIKFHKECIPFFILFIATILHIVWSLFLVIVQIFSFKPSPVLLAVGDGIITWFLAFLSTCLALGSITGMGQVDYCYSLSCPLVLLPTLFILLSCFFASHPFAVNIWSLAPRLKTNNWVGTRFRIITRAIQLVAALASVTVIALNHFNHKTITFHILVMVFSTMWSVCAIWFSWKLASHERIFLIGVMIIDVVMMVFSLCAGCSMLGAYVIYKWEIYPLFCHYFGIVCTKYVVIITLLLITGVMNILSAVDLLSISANK